MTTKQSIHQTFNDLILKGMAMVRGIRKVDIERSNSLLMALNDAIDAPTINEQVKRIEVVLKDFAAPSGVRS